MSKTSTSIPEEILHEEGFTITRFGRNKRPQTPDGGTGTGLKRCRPQEPLHPDYKHWEYRGITPTEQTARNERGNYMFVDIEDANKTKRHAPALLDFAFQQRRKVDGNDEYYSKHGILKITDATPEQCQYIKKAYSNKKLGYEFLFDSNALMTWGDAEYEARDADGDKVIKTSRWEMIPEAPLIHKITFAEFQAFNLPQPKPPNPTTHSNVIIPAGQGMRHDAIRSALWRIITRMKKNNELVNFDNCFAKIQNEGKIEGMEEYRTDAKQQEFDQLVKSIDDLAGKETADLAVRLVDQEGVFWVHDLSNLKDQFALAWLDVVWREDSTYKILQILHERGKHIPGFTPTEQTAKHVKTIIASRKDTATYDPKAPIWRGREKRYRYDAYGQGWDLQTGSKFKIADDPGTHYFKTPHYRIRIGDKKSEIWKECMEDIFSSKRGEFEGHDGKMKKYSYSDYELWEDEWSVADVHKSDHGIKPHDCTVQGSTDTNKSVLIELEKAIRDPSRQSGVSRDEMARNPRFAKYNLAGKDINVEEEGEAGRLAKVGMYKDVATNTEGPYEKKNGRQEWASRFPHCREYCNDIRIWPDDTDLDAILNKMSYIQTKKGSGKDWREALDLSNPDSKHLPDILYSQLVIASRIYKKGGKPHYLPDKQVAARYKSLVGGTFEAFCHNHYKIIGGTEYAIPTEDVIEMWRETQKSTLSPQSLIAYITNTKGLTYLRARVHPQGDGVWGVEGQTAGDPIQRTLVFGLVTKDWKPDSGN